MAASVPYAPVAPQRAAARRSAQGAAPAARVRCARPAHPSVAARCLRARLCVAATKGDASGSGASKAGVDDWISRWKDRKSTGEEAPLPLSAEAVLSGPDPRTAFRYVFAGGLSAEACAFSALILRDALEPRGVRLHATQLTPQDGSPWTLRRVAVALRSLLAPADAQLGRAQRRAASL